MLPSMKKAWGGWATASPAYPQLAAILYDEKAVAVAVEKWIDAKKQASATNREWAKVEKNKLLKDMFTSLEEANDLDMKVHANFLEKHNHYRKIFKDIRQDKIMFDDMKKQTEQLENKVHKMFKSYESVQRKRNDPSRATMAHEELKKALKAKEEFHDALDNRLDEINLQTLQRVREGLLELMDESADLHRKMLISLDEQRKLVNLYLPDECITELPNLTKAQVSADKILSNLTDELQIPRPLSRGDIYAGVSFQAFRYIPDKELVLSPSVTIGGDVVNIQRTRSSTAVDNSRQNQIGRGKNIACRLLSEGESAPHHLKPLPAPRPAHSLTDLRNVGIDHRNNEIDDRNDGIDHRNIQTDLRDEPETYAIARYDSDEDYELFAESSAYLSLINEEEMNTPSDASDLYEKLSDWLSKQSPRSSFNKDEEPPPVPKRLNLRGKPPKPPVKPKDIHKRFEMSRQRSQSTGTLDSRSTDG
ncbi:uncharacterized protein LOC135494799 [Lineus longissimus]|uniref:uncharacterized protein LOC135494799 n=1 Tax=Lineus longissimus TaxID=88925 RepID=UPI002B4CC1B6